MRILSKKRERRIVIRLWRYFRLAQDYAKELNEALNIIEITRQEMILNFEAQK